MATTITVLVSQITNIRPHPDADKLELSQVNGWELVVPKGKYHDGDIGIYIPEDSLVPDEWALRWGIKAYLKGANNNRVGKISLRGSPSFGVFVDIPEGQNWELGTNVAEHFGISRYEAPIRTTCGDADKENSLIQRYTDIDNLRNYPTVFENGEEVIATEKLHGSNEKLGFIEGVEVAGSMSFPRKRPVKLIGEDPATQVVVPCELDSPEVKANTYWFPWSIPAVQDLLRGIYEETKSKQILIYGEVFGSSIQKGFTYGFVGSISFRAFDLLVDGRYLNYDDFKAVCAKYGVETCPVVYRGPYSIEKIAEVSGGKSLLDGKTLREGVVVCPPVERTHRKVGRLKMKFVSTEYLNKRKSEEDVKDT
jgi:RNA ligase (TIGR02306 family)